MAERRSTKGGIAENNVVYAGGSQMLQTITELKRLHPHVLHIQPMRHRELRED